MNVISYLLDPNNRVLTLTLETLTFFMSLYEPFTLPDFLGIWILEFLQKFHEYDTKGCIMSEDT